MACGLVKNKKNNIKNPIRLNIVSCSPVHPDSKMPICYLKISIDIIPLPNTMHFPKTFFILIGNYRGFLHQFRLAPDDR